MNKNWKHPKNDGWTDVSYDFGSDQALNKGVGYILNEACHVFYFHAEGTWAKFDKESYAELLAIEFKKHPKLSYRVLKTNDRVVKMVAYRALELLKS